MKEVATQLQWQYGHHQQVLSCLVAILTNTGFGSAG